MKPDPERAAQLRAHFQNGFRGIAKQLWPQLHLVLAVDSGSNQIYGEMLRESYCQGVNFYSPFYAATEGTKNIWITNWSILRVTWFCLDVMNVDFVFDIFVEENKNNKQSLVSIVKSELYSMISEVNVLTVWSNSNMAPAGLIGVNLWPQESSRRYVLCPRSMFCEFLPESSLEEASPPTLLMEEVMEGQNYELVITNASGLFRFEICFLFTSPCIEEKCSSSFIHC